MYGGARVLGTGHRVVHGGARYSCPTVVNPQVLGELHRLVPRAPLHQPYNLAAIEAVSERLPDVPQIACFDTSFHRGQPAVAEVIPLPDEIRREGVQLYGFHGLSYQYIASVLPEVAPEIASGVWDSPLKKWRQFSTRSLAYLAFPASAMTCATFLEAPSRERAWLWTILCIVPRRRSARWPRYWEESTDWCSPRGLLMAKLLYGR